MENRIRIREARARCKELGIKTKGIVEIAWNVLKYRCKDADNAYKTLNKYVTGEYSKLDPRAVQILSREYHIDANFLFDTPPMKSKREEELEKTIAELREELKQYKR